MTSTRQNRIFAGCGLAYVALALGGALVAMSAGKTHDLTVGSSTAKLAAALARPAGTGVWVGAYMEMLAVLPFVAFAVWAATRLGGGLLGSIVRGAAVANATATVVSLGINDAVAYRAGHGMSVPVARALVTVNEAIFVGSWFLTALFLIGAGALAVAARRRALGWSALGIAAFALIGAAVSFDGAGQFSILLWFVWAACAAVALARSERAPRAAVAVA
jgi:hypothetical protein